MAVKLKERRKRGPDKELGTLFAIGGAFYEGEGRVSIDFRGAEDERSRHYVILPAREVADLVRRLVSQAGWCAATAAQPSGEAWKLADPKAQRDAALAILEGVRVQIQNGWGDL